MKKLAIVTTHPIQYNAPFFKLLTERGKVAPKVFYTWPQALEGFTDEEFGKDIQWDIPLLDGYDWEAVENVSKNPGSKNWGGIDCPNLIHQIKAFQPDAVLIYGWNFKSHFKVMRYFKGKVPLWFTGDSTLLDEKPGWQKMMRRILLRWVYWHIDMAFYVGSNNRKYFQVHGLKENQLIHFPHAIDNERFADNEERQYETSALTWRKELGYDDDDIVLLFAGKFETKKNPILLIETLIEFHNSSNPSIHGLLIGNGPLEKELKQLAKEYENIKFLPFKNQSLMPVVYRLGDIFCLPSTGPGETWGLAVNEAMSCSKPVIVSNKVGCAADLVLANVTGKVFDCNKTFDLKKALLTLIRSDLKEMGKRSLNHIQNWNFTNKCIAIENAISRD